MIHLIKKLWYKYILNRHLCEEFTQWEKKECDWTKPVELVKGVIVDHLTYTKI